MLTTDVEKLIYLHNIKYLYILNLMIIHSVSPGDASHLQKSGDSLHTQKYI